MYYLTRLGQGVFWLVCLQIYWCALGDAAIPLKGRGETAGNIMRPNRSTKRATAGPWPEERGGGFGRVGPSIQEVGDSVSKRGVFGG